MSQRTSLTASSLVDGIFRKGRRLKGQHLQLYLKKEKNFLQPVFCVAKNSYKNKPERNRLRRLLKEAYRSQAEKLLDKEVNVALMITSGRAALQELREELASLIKLALKTL